MMYSLENTDKKQKNLGDLGDQLGDLGDRPAKNPR